MSQPGSRAVPPGVDPVGTRLPGRRAALEPPMLAGVQRSLADQRIERAACLGFADPLLDQHVRHILVVTHCLSSCGTRTPSDDQWQKTPDAERPAPHSERAVPVEVANLAACSGTISASSSPSPRPAACVGPLACWASASRR